MVKFEFEYIEIDGLLYLSIEIEGKADLDNLRKYGRLRLNYCMSKSRRYIVNCLSLENWQRRFAPPIWKCIQCREKKRWGVFAYLR